jgi:hypothetical protein
MGLYCLDLVTPGTYLHNTMDETDIIHALNQYVEKLNIVLNNLLEGKICRHVPKVPYGSYAPVYIVIKVNFIQL